MCCGGDNVQTVTQEMKPWAEDFYKWQIEQIRNQYGIAQNAYDAQKDYKPYPGQRIADFTPDQKAAFDAVRGADGVWKPELDQAGQYAQQSTQRFGQAYTPQQVSAQGIAALPQVQGASYDPAKVDRAGTQIGGIGDVQNTTFGTEQMNQYMSPYRQGVIDQTVNEMLRANDKARLSDQARATKAGAFGGSRHGILDAERERNFQTTLGNTVGQLLDQGYGQARDQFNTDTARGVDVQKTNVGNQIDVAKTNAGTAADLAKTDAAAANQAGQFAAGASQQAQQFNTGMEFQRQDQNAGRNLQAGMFNSDMGLKGWNANAGQFNAEQGRMQDAARVMAGIGGQRQQQSYADANARYGIGAFQQALGQQNLDVAYGDWQQQQEYPWQQLGRLSGAMRMQPMQTGTTTTSSSGGPGFFQQAAGLGIAGLGALSGGPGIAANWNALWS
jgi:hypothetical protein